MRHFVGIDHGTTYSAVSALAPGQTIPSVVELGQAEPQIPTAAFFDPAGGPTIVGTAAINQAVNRPDAVLRWYKPKMETDPKFTFAGRNLTQVAAEVLGSIKRDVEAKLNEPLERALLTVPAWFHSPAREMTKDAAKLAGIAQVELEDEPTAAAFFYHRTAKRLQPNEVLAVYDLGGGTFDVSIVEHLADGNLRVLASHGDMDLGGHLWTMKLQENLANRYRQAHGLDPSVDPADAYDLYAKCETCKRQLTALGSANVRVHPQAGKPETHKVSRKDFEEMTVALLQKTGQVLKEAARKANLSWDKIARVLLVGGTTRMAQIEDYVKEQTGRVPELLDNRDQMVAHGAAMLLDARQRKVNVKLIRATTPHPLATWVKKGRQLACSVIIPAQADVPATGSRTFKRQRDNATEIDVPVFQSGTEGEIIDLAKGHTQAGRLFLKKYRFSGIPALPALDNEIKVTFAYNLDKTIEVNAVFRPGTPEEAPLSGRKDDWPVGEGDATGTGDCPIVAILDCSSSMSGSRIQEAKDQLVKVAQQYAGNGFTFSVVTFPHRIFSGAGEVVRAAGSADEAAPGH